MGKDYWKFMGKVPTSSSAIARAKYIMEQQRNAQAQALQQQQSNQQNQSLQQMYGGQAQLQNQGLAYIVEEHGGYFLTGTTPSLIDVVPWYVELGAEFNDQATSHWNP